MPSRNKYVSCVLEAMRLVDKVVSPSHFPVSLSDLSKSPLGRPPESEAGVGHCPPLPLPLCCHCRCRWLWYLRPRCLRPHMGEDDG